MDLRWEGTQGSSARQTCSAASVTPRSPCSSSSSSMQWEESFLMLSSTRRWGKGVAGEEDLWEICWIFITPSLQTCVRDGEGAGAAGSRPDRERRPGGEIVEWEEGDPGVRLRLHPSAQPPEVRSLSSTFSWPGSPPPSPSGRLEGGIPGGIPCCKIRHNLSPS